MNANINIETIDKLAYSIFGKYSKGEKYKELQPTLRQARIGVPFDVYISRALLMSLVFAFPCGIITAYLFVKGFVAAQSFFGSYAYIIFVPSFSVFFALSLYQLFISYPAFMSKLRARKIDISLPNAIALLHALSRGRG